MGSDAEVRGRAKKILGDQLSALSQREDGPGWRYAVWHTLTTLATGFLLALTLDTPWWPLTLFLHGVVIVHWFAPFHEAAHYTVFRDRRLNRLLGRITGLIIWQPFEYFRLEHRHHHLYTNDPARDSEYIPHSRTVGGWWWYASAVPYFYALFTQYGRFATARFTPLEREFLGQKGQRYAQREAWAMMGFYFAVILLAWALNGLELLWWYWILPRFVGEPLMRVIRMSEHGGCGRVPDMLQNTRTVRAWWPLKVLAWNMCYHAEHHAVASIPFHQLERAHQTLGPHLSELCGSYWQASAVTLQRASTR